MITAVFLTRIIYLGLGDASYGYWGLLWSIFGYSLLLDFGFGVSVQKYTSEVTVTKDFKTYNALLSTVFTTYFFLCILIVIVTLILQFFLDRLFQFPAGSDMTLNRWTFICFGVGTALGFQVGAFSEILKGLKQIYLRNIIVIATQFIYIFGVWLVFKLGYGILQLAIFSVGINVVRNCVMAVFCYRQLKGIKIHPRYYDSSLLKGVFSFSLFAYLITFGNLVIFKTSQILLGVMIGVEAVAVYQLGSRLSEMLMRFSTQFQDNLSPIAASLYKAGELERLRRILLRSNRLIGLLAFILFLGLTILAKPLLHIWLHVDDPQAIHVTYIMNVSMFVYVLFRSGSSQVLLMADKHKLLSAVAVIESTSNILLSILFVHMFGVIGVTLGVIIPNVIMSIFVVFPVASAFSRISVLEFIKVVYIPLILVSIPAASLLIGAVAVTPPDSWNLIRLGLVSCAAGLLYVIPAYFFVLPEEEKSALHDGASSAFRVLAKLRG
jgi:O-antigen/teichoic acid export membrane protein